MKKTSFIVLFVLVLASAFFVIRYLDNHSESGYTGSYEDKNYLAEVLKNLEQIKSATYFAKLEGFAPGDTVPSKTYHNYYIEYDNPADTTIGASFVKLLPEDTTKMVFCYDGTMKALVDWKRNYMAIDSFHTTRFSFRPMNTPFFNYSNSVLKYAMENKDSTTVHVKDFGDSVKVSLSIYADKQLEFFGKPFFTANAYGLDQEVSRYDVWIGKSNNLPYRVIREMSSETTVFTCSNPKFNENDIKDFVASNYFPTDVPLGTRPPEKSNLIGKVAPDWILKNADNNTVSLQQIKSKAMMIQFTSVSCGPCRLSVPFLNTLASEYKKDDFNFVSIEKSTRSIEALRRYQEKSEINYPFLMSTEDATKNYQVDMVPVFYILDKDKVVRNVFMGYRKGKTDKEIRDAINKLI